MKRLIVGRDHSCNIIFSDTRVGRLHAELIIEDDGKCYIIDLNSVNGTFVNNIKIQAHKRVALINSSEVKIANTYILDWKKYQNQPKHEPIGTSPNPDRKKIILPSKTPKKEGYIVFELIDAFYPDFSKQVNLFWKLLHGPVKYSMYIAEDRFTPPVTPAKFFSFGIISFIGVSAIFGLVNQESPELDFSREFKLQIWFIVNLLLGSVLNFFVFKIASASKKTFDQYFIVTLIISGMAYILLSIFMLAMFILTIVQVEDDILPFIIVIAFIIVIIWLIIKAFLLNMRFWNLSFAKVLFYSLVVGVISYFISVTTESMFPEFSFENIMGIPEDTGDYNFE